MRIMNPENRQLADEIAQLRKTVSLMGAGLKTAGFHECAACGIWSDDKDKFAQFPGAETCIECISHDEDYELPEIAPYAIANGVAKLWNANKAFFEHPSTRLRPARIRNLVAEQFRRKNRGGILYPGFNEDQRRFCALWATYVVVNAALEKQSVMDAWLPYYGNFPHITSEHDWCGEITMFATKETRRIAWEEHSRLYAERAEKINAEKESATA